MSHANSVSSVDRSKIWRTGALAVAASVVANLLTFFILSALLDLPAAADFPPLSVGAIGFLTAVFTLAGVGVFALVARRSQRPVRTFWIVATVAFVVSIIPNITAAANPDAAPFPFEVMTSQAFLVLIVFHVIAYLITTWLLTTRTQAQ